MRIAFLLFLALSRVSSANDTVSVSSLPIAEQEKYILGVLTEVGWEKCFTLTISADENPICGVSKNASDDGLHEISITEGFIRLVQTRDEWIAVLAHETSHIVLGHETAFILAQRQRPLKISPATDEEIDYMIAFIERVEIEADGFAVNFMLNHNYDPCVSMELLARTSGNLNTSNPMALIAIHRLKLFENVCHAAP